MVVFLCPNSLAGVDDMNETPTRRGRPITPLPKRSHGLHIPITERHFEMLRREAEAAGYFDLAPYIREVKLQEPPLIWVRSTEDPTAA